MNALDYKRKLKWRHLKCRLFRSICVIAILFSVAFLAFFFYDIIHRAVPAFTRTEIKQPIDYQSAADEKDPTDIGAKYGSPGYAFDEEVDTGDILSRQVYWDVEKVLKEKELEGKPFPDDGEQWLLASSDVDQYVKNGLKGKLENKKEVLALVDKLQEEGKVRTVRTWSIFTESDSRNPELAGIKGAAVGSVLVILVTIIVSVPIGVMTSLYLEEYAGKSRFATLVEVNINNLAAVPSIIFGLLGLLVFINVMGIQRSTPLVGGLTLGLMMLPIIIISTRAALRSVPNNIREAALAVGASRWQTIQHHVLPLAIPGILTGTILSMAQAIGETAPLLMVGLNSFVTDVPSGVYDSSSTLPTLIFQWAGSSERGFTEKTAAAILIMLVILIVMNGLAVWMRNKFERRW